MPGQTHRRGSFRTCRLCEASIRRLITEPNAKGFEAHKCPEQNTRKRSTVDKNSGLVPFWWRDRATRGNHGQPVKLTIVQFSAVQH
jgi:hypothetical protein